LHALSKACPEEALGLNVAAEGTKGNETNRRYLYNEHLKRETKMEELRCEEIFRELSPAPGYNQNQNQQVAYNQPLVCRAYKDPVILEDNRVFQNMLDIEEFYIAATNYFATTQSEIKPHMRKIVTDWMLEVSKFYFFRR
jgi:Cyclin, N-terminal domain